MSIKKKRDAERLIDRKELRIRVPYSQSQISRMEKAGRFPSRIQIGPGRVAWSSSEVADWIQCKKEGRDWHGGTHG